MELTTLINHPERLDRDTLFELRSMLALHPYFQTARLLMLQNLYILHDASFDEELRRAAIYITNRKTIFSMVEAAHYQLRQHKATEAERPAAADGDRTATLIDSFLETIPPEEEELEKKPAKRKPTPADATIDYVAYLLQSEEQDNTQDSSPHMRGQDLIDSFLEQERGRILLSDLPIDSPQEEEEDANNSEEEEYFTETLARIYIKQGRYQKAYDIIGRLREKYPNKNVYFADQMRFLEKLIVNSNQIKN